jgi:hypothetical protein
MTTTTEVSDSLERVDSIVNMLDEICDHMDGFSSAEEAWLFQHHRNVAHLALCHARNLRRFGRKQRRLVASKQRVRPDKIPAWHHVHCGFIWQMLGWALAIAVVPVATNSFTVISPQTKGCQYR